MSSHGDQKNGNCNNCGVEIPVDDLKQIIWCGQPDVKFVCESCYEEIKSEYEIIEEF